MDNIETLTCKRCGASAPPNIEQGKPYKCENCGNTCVWPRQESIKVIFQGDNHLCPNCGLDNPSKRSVCRNCGEKLTKRCPICNDEFYIGDNYCNNGHKYEIPKVIPKPPPVPTPVLKPPFSKSKGIKSLMVLLFGLIVCLVIGGIVIGVLVSSGSVVTDNNVPNWALVTQIAENFATQNAPASREDLEGEISSFVQNPDAFITFSRIGDGTQEEREKYGLYEIRNNSQFSWMTIGCWYCPFVDFYYSEALPQAYGMSQEEIQLYPEMVRQINIKEYHQEWNWVADEVCIEVTLTNQAGNASTEKCFDSLIKFELVQFVHISARRLQSNSIEYSGLVEVTFEVDETIPYFPIKGNNPYGFNVGDSMTMSPDPQERDSYSGLYKPDTTDSRVLVRTDDFDNLYPGMIVRYAYLYNNYQPSSICFDLSDAYAAASKICSLVQ